MPGQPQLGTLTAAIGIDCTKLEVIDAGVPSNLIVEAGSTFQLQTRFELGGLFAPWIVSLGVPYTISYYQESFGNNPEGLIVSKPGTTVTGQLVYEAETTANASIAEAGTYKLTVVVSFGGSPPLTAFFEGPVIEVF